MHVMKRYVLVLGIVLASIGLDRWTKVLAETHLQGSPLRNVLGQFFQLVFVENTGAFLSFGADFPYALRLVALTILPTLMLVGVFLYTLLGRGLTWWQIIAFSFISGGGISNLYDRITEGKVVDFMIMGVGQLRTGVFNIADVCIMIGLFMMLPTMLGLDKRRLHTEVVPEAKSDTNQPE